MYFMYNVVPIIIHLFIQSHETNLCKLLKMYSLSIWLLVCTGNIMRVTGHHQDWGPHGGVQSERAPFFVTADMTVNLVPGLTSFVVGGNPFNLSDGPFLQLKNRNIVILNLKSYQEYWEHILFITTVNMST